MTWGRKLITSFKGFTLVEVIVVVAILGVLVGILVPNYQNQVSKNQARMCEVERTQLAASYGVYLINNRVEHSNEKWGEFLASGIYQGGGCPNGGIDNFTWEDGEVKCELEQHNP